MKKLSSITKKITIIFILIILSLLLVGLVNGFDPSKSCFLNGFGNAMCHRGNYKCIECGREACCRDAATSWLEYRSNSACIIQDCNAGYTCVAGSCVPACSDVYSNDCDNKTECGTTRDTSPYNSCDLTEDTSCNVETLCDNIDNDCDGTVDNGICTCGNSIIESKTGYIEQCDNGANNGQLCDAPYGGTCDYCAANCELITLDGGSCPNGVREGPEQCDDGNTVDGDGCNSTCSIEATPLCPNLIIEPGEQCVNNDFGRLNCSDFDQFTEGELSCDNCIISTSQCTGGTTGTCGDGIVNTGEQCDKDPSTGVEDWGQITGCSDFGNFNYGQLSCNLSTCQFATSYCYINSNLAYCGDNAINQTTEECDGTDLTATCPATLPLGSTTCDPYCQVDNSGCYNQACQINSVSINLGDCHDIDYDGDEIIECRERDEISITADVTSSLTNPLSCSNFILQIDAQDKAGDCKILAANGNLKGINVQCTGSTCQGDWEVPDNITQNEDCAGLLVNGTQAKLISKDDFNIIEATFDLDPILSFIFEPEEQKDDPIVSCYENGDWGTSTSKDQYYCSSDNDGTYYECIDHNYVKQAKCAMECGASPQCWFSKEPSEPPCDEQCIFIQTSCWDEWSCGGWSDCVNGKQTRSCIGDPSVCPNPYKEEAECIGETKFPIYSPINMLLTAFILVGFYFVFKRNRKL